MSNAETSVVPGGSRFRRIVQLVAVVVILAALGYAVARNREDFADTWTRIGTRGASVAMALGLANGVFTWMQWRTVLRGLGVEIVPRTSARIFFVSQLGKYVPGAVWPLVLQTESTRRHGADRKAVIAGNLIVMAVSLTTGLLLAGLLLPFSVPSALGRFWWTLAALPLLVIAIHPRTLLAGLNVGLRKLGRPALDVRLPGVAILSSMGWSLLAWLALGGQIAVLCDTVGARGSGLYALSTGGVALAVCAGLLFLPAPAGAGPREVVLLYVLSAVLPTGAALAVAVASRVLVVASDLLLAAVGAVLGGVRRR